MIVNANVEAELDAPESSIPESVSASSTLLSDNPGLLDSQAANQEALKDFLEEYNLSEYYNKILDWYSGAFVDIPAPSYQWSSLQGNFLVYRYMNHDNTSLNLDILLNLDISLNKGKFFTITKGKWYRSNQLPSHEHGWPQSSLTKIDPRTNA